MTGEQRQTIRRLDVQTIDASIRHQLGQAIQAGTRQRCTIEAVVDELSLSWHPELIFQHVDAQGSWSDVLEVNMLRLRADGVG